MILLTVLTPRAGQWNHRYLVSDAKHFSEKKLDVLFQDAVRNSNSDRFLSVSRTVMQRNSGRSATETVILQDTRIPHLSTTQKNQLLKKLSHFAESDLETLISRNIEWEVQGKKPVIYRQELQETAQQFQKDIDRLANNNPVSFTWGKIIMASSFAALLIVAFFWDGIPRTDKVEFTGLPCTFLEAPQYTDQTCQVSRNNSRYLTLCHLLTDSSKCDAEKIETGLGRLVAQGCDQDWLLKSFNTYQLKRRWSPKLLGNKILLDELGLRSLPDPMNMAQLCNARNKVISRKKLLDTFIEKLPVECRKSLLPPDDQGENTSDTVLMTKSFLGVMKKDFKAPCVVRGIEPLKNCSFSDAVSLFDFMDSCEPNLEENELEDLERKGYQSEAAILRALKWLFENHNRNEFTD